MTKAEVAAKLSSTTGLSQKEAVQALEIFLDAIRQALIQGEKVSLVGFGAFLIKDREPRSGRNPRTGEIIDIPMRRAIVFKPGKSFREQVDR